MPILHLAGKAPYRRRPVNSALGLTMNLCLGFVLVVVLLAGATGDSAAQPAASSAAEPKYTIKADEPRLGSHIRSDRFRGRSIALNLPYHQLPVQDRLALHNWWEHIEPGDEPLFPAGGLVSIYRLIGSVNERRHQQGELLVVATVNPQGLASEVRILASPTPELGEATAKILLATKFKPAICAGAPCTMDFPVRLVLHVKR